MLDNILGAGTLLTSEGIKGVFYIQLKVVRRMIVVLSFSISGNAQANLPSWEDMSVQPKSCHQILDIIEIRLGGMENYKPEIFSPSDAHRHWTVCTIQDKNTDTFITIKIFDITTFEEAQEAVTGGNVTINGQPYILKEGEKKKLLEFLQGFYDQYRK